MIRKSRRLLAVGAVAVTAAMAMSACSSSNDNTKQSSDAKETSQSSTDTAASGTLTVWVDSDRLAVLEPLAQEYTTKTGVKVELIDKSIDDMKADFARDAPTGNGPDIIMGAHDWIGGYVTDGIIAPIELGDTAADFSDIALNAVTYDGQVYQLPYAVENIGILRNVDLAPDATPATWDEMIAKGKEIGKKYPFVVTQNGREGDPYHIYPLQASFGCSVFGLNDKGEFDAANLTLGSDECMSFATWLGTVGDIITADITGDVAKQAFLDGEAPYWLTGQWSLPDAQAAGMNVAVDPIPSAGGKEATPFAGVKGFYINAQSKNQVIANDFLINFIATEEVQYALFEKGQVLPANKAAAEKALADPMVKGFQAAGANAIPMPAISVMADVWTPWGIAEGDILAGENPKTTWEQLVKDIQAVIDASK